MHCRVDHRAGNLLAAGDEFLAEDDDVNGDPERREYRAESNHLLEVAGVVLVDHEQVEVAVGTGFASGMRPEQNHAGGTARGASEELGCVTDRSVGEHDRHRIAECERRGVLAGVEAVEELRELVADERPVERLGDLVVAVLEVVQGTRELGGAQVVGGKQLALDDRVINLDLLIEARPRWSEPLSTIQNTRLNTKSIHREVMKLYRGAVVPDVRGPLGRAVELHHAEDPAEVVAGVIERLCGEEEIPPQDIVVLSAHGWENSRVAHAPARGRHTLTKERGRLGRYVHFSSIRAFKGLESPVVILCELEDLDDDTADQQLYVGLSRARNHCVIVAPPAASDSDPAGRP